MAFGKHLQMSLALCLQQWLFTEIHLYWVTKPKVMQDQVPFFEHLN